MVNLNRKTLKSEQKLSNSKRKLVDFSRHCSSPISCCVHGTVSVCNEDKWCSRAACLGEDLWLSTSTPPPPPLSTLAPPLPPPPTHTLTLPLPPFCFALFGFRFLAHHSRRPREKNLNKKFRPKGDGLRNV